MRKRLVIGAVVALGAVLLLYAWLNWPIGLSVSNQRQYWTQQVSAVMGPAWQLTSVKRVSAPDGWGRTAGGGGIEVSFAAPSITLHHPIVGPYHPRARLYLMPSTWAGTCHLNGQEFIVGWRGYRVEGRAMSQLQAYPAVYQGRTWRYHLFRSSVGDGGLIDWDRLEGTLGPRLKPPPKRPPLPWKPKP